MQLLVMGKKLVSDNGTAFKNKVFEQFTKSMNISHQFSCPYWPRGNRQSERVNGSFKDFLSIVYNYQSHNWVKYVPEFLFYI